MFIKSNLPEFIANLQRIRDTVATGGGASGSGTNFTDVVASALNQGMGAMKNRIFNQALDAEGESLGAYTGPKTSITVDKFPVKKYGNPATNKANAKRYKAVKGKVGTGEKFTEYEKKRLAQGRQIVKKDLELGGGLRRSIEVVINNRKVSIAFTNDLNAEIARYQEQQIASIRATGKSKGGSKRAPIFRLSKEEFERVRQAGNDGVVAAIRRIMANN